MVIEITKLSSKGQIVIPQEIRKEMNLKEGTLFTVTSQNNTLCLKKVKIPKILLWDEAVKPFRKAAKKSNFKQEDLEKLIFEVRAKK